MRTSKGNRNKNKKAENNNKNKIKIMRDNIDSRNKTADGRTTALRACGRVDEWSAQDEKKHVKQARKPLV